MKQLLDPPNELNGLLGQTTMEFPFGLSVAPIDQHGSAGLHFPTPMQASDK